MTASDAPQLHDAVRLLVDLPDDGLTAGRVGAVVMVHDAPVAAYEVEFAGEDGRTVALLALLPPQVERA